MFTPDWWIYLIGVPIRGTGTAEEFYASPPDGDTKAFVTLYPESSHLNPRSLYSLILVVCQLRTHLPIAASITHFVGRVPGVGAAIFILS